jgi:hypothetical protein
MTQECLPTQLIHNSDCGYSCTNMPQKRHEENLILGLEPRTIYSVQVRFSCSTSHHSRFCVPRNITSLHTSLSPSWHNFCNGTKAQGGNVFPNIYFQQAMDYKSRLVLRNVYTSLCMMIIVNIIMITARFITRTRWAEHTAYMGRWEMGTYFSHKTWWELREPRHSWEDNIIIDELSVRRVIMNKLPQFGRRVIYLQLLPKFGSVRSRISLQDIKHLLSIVGPSPCSNHSRLPCCVHW